MMPCSVRAGRLSASGTFLRREAEFCQQILGEVLTEGDIAFPHRITPFTTYRSPAGIGGSVISARHDTSHISFDAGIVMVMI
jgi:hypothetical protein